MSKLSLKNVAKAAATALAIQCSETGTLDESDQANVCTIAETALAQVVAEAKQEEKAYLATDEGKHRKRLALLAGKARQLALGLNERSAFGHVVTEQGRRGLAIRKVDKRDATPESLASALAQALAEAPTIKGKSMKPSAYVPQVGQKTATAPAAVTALHQLRAAVKFAALAANAKPVEMAAAKAG